MPVHRGVRVVEVECVGGRAVDQCRREATRALRSPEDARLGRPLAAHHDVDQDLAQGLPCPGERDAQKVEETVARDLTRLGWQLLPAKGSDGADERSGDPVLEAHEETSPRPRRASLDVLYLLAQLLGLGLRSEHELADRQVTRLRAGRGELTMHLLEQELDPLADRTACGEGRIERGQVALEAHELLGDVAPLGEDRGLLCDPARVQLRRPGEANEPLLDA